MRYHRKPIHLRRRFIISTCGECVLQSRRAYSTDNVQRRGKGEIRECLIALNVRVPNNSIRFDRTSLSCDSARCLQLILMNCHRMQRRTHPHNRLITIAGHRRRCRQGRSSRLVSMSSLSVIVYSIKIDFQSISTDRACSHVNMGNVDSFIFHIPLRNGSIMCDEQLKMIVL